MPNADRMPSWNTVLLLSSLICPRTHWEKMLTTFEPPLARALQSQTQFQTRLRLILAVHPSNGVHALLAQHTIDTVCDRRVSRSLVQRSFHSLGCHPARVFSDAHRRYISVQRVSCRRARYSKPSMNSCRRHLFEFCL